MKRPATKALSQIFLDEIERLLQKPRGCAAGSCAGSSRPDFSKPLKLPMCSPGRTAGCRRPPCPAAACRSAVGRLILLILLCSRRRSAVGGVVPVRMKTPDPMPLRTRVAGSLGCLILAILAGLACPLPHATAAIPGEPEGSLITVDYAALVGGADLDFTMPLGPGAERGLVHSLKCNIRSDGSQRCRGADRMTCSPRH